jgi:peptide deformylase
MATRPIILYPNLLLRTPADPVTKVDREIREIVQDLWDTMYARGGVGLAGNQIGVLKQIFVMDPQREGESPPLVCINPRFISMEGKVQSEEGCLSIPGFRAEVIRFQKVKMEMVTLTEEEVTVELSGFSAIIAQHEADHLQGVLFVDRLSWAKRIQFEKEFGSDPYRKKNPNLPHILRTSTPKKIKI